MRRMIPRSQEPERGFVLAVLAQGVDADDELAEIEELARTAGVEVVGRAVQHRARPAQRSYVGKGKLDELKEGFEAAEAESLLVDDELDLELSFCRDGVLGEDVEDQLCAVDHARAELVLEIALLHWVELVVDEEALGLGVGEALLELGELSLADIGALRRPGSVLYDAAYRLDACGPRQLLDLGQLLVGIRPLGQDREDEPALRLLGTWNHQAALCPPPLRINSSPSARSLWSTSRRCRATRRSCTGTSSGASTFRSPTTTVSRSCTRSGREGRS